MRALVATGIAVCLAALASGAQAREVSIYRGKCGEVVLPQGPSGVRNTIEIDTSCGTFLVGEQRVRFVGVRRKQFKHDGLVGRGRELVLYDRGRVVWRSGLRGMREWPLGLTRAGILVMTEGRLLRARAPSGRLIRILADHIRTSRFDTRTRTVLYVSRRGDLARTDGLRTQRLAPLEGRLLSRGLELVPLEEGRVALVGKRFIVVGSDGSVVASDRRRGSLPAISSNGAIAMISTGPLDEHGRADESVRLLRPGERSSTPLHLNEVGALGCGHWPSLGWRGDDLLYSTNVGDVVVIDPSSADRFDLSALVRRLPGEFLEARWS